MEWTQPPEAAAEIVPERILALTVTDLRGGCVPDCFSLSDRQRMFAAGGGCSRMTGRDMTTFQPLENSLPNCGVPVEGVFGCAKMFSA